MKINLNNKLNEFLKIIAKNAQIQKIRVFFVGGFVRDYILNKTTQDIDIIIEGNAIDFLKSLEEIEIKSIHDDFKTVKVKYDDLELDIASTRIEKYPHSGCLPELTKCGVSIEEDVKRRDFTINSLYSEIKFKNNELSFEIIDLVNGIKDLKEKKLKVLHDNSYIDDPTRILRGLDFKYRFNFDFSSKDKTLIKEAIEKIDYQNQTNDRIKNVFLKVLSKEYSSKIFNEIINNKIYKILFNHNLCANCKNIEKIAQIFNLNLEQKANYYFQIIENKEIEIIKNKTKFDIFNNFSKFNSQNLAYYFYKTNDSNAIEFLKIKDIKLNIKGQDILNLGYSKGKIIGEILDKLLAQKLEKPEVFIKKEDEINWIKTNYPNF